jgi:hypothetical protein
MPKTTCVVTTTCLLIVTQFYVLTVFLQLGHVAVQLLPYSGLEWKRGLSPPNHHYYSKLKGDTLYSSTFLRALLLSSAIIYLS